MRKIVSLTAILSLFITMVIAQTRVITGKIADKNGDPVPFVTVSVKGSPVKVAAGNDGLFKISAKTGDILVFTAVGLTPVESVVTAAGVVNVTGEIVSTSLTEVVVTAFGIAKQSKSLGYSTEKVNGKDMVAAKPISLANGLTGKVSGLEISTVNNGVFAPTRITLRGNRSLIGNNQPLVIVDGAIFYNDISTLNPEDIESVNILKGSSASAIYGSDASNGVMIINTKHGSGVKPSISFTTTSQYEKVAYLPAFQTEFGSSGGEEYLYNYTDLNTYIPFENQQYGPMFNGATVPLGRPVASTDKPLMVPYSGNPNQKKDFFNTGFTEQNNLSYSAGDENGRIFMSAQDIKSQNVMPGDVGHRDVFRLGGGKKYGAFSGDFSLSYTYSNTNTTNTGSVYNNLLNTPNEVPITSLKNWQTGVYSTPDGYYNDYFVNPYWVIGNVRNISTVNSLEGNVHLGLQAAKWLKFDYRLSINNSTQKYEYKQGEADYSNFTGSNDTVLFSNAAGNGTVVNTNFGTKWIDANNGYKQPVYNTSTASNFLITSDFIGSVKTKITKDISFNGSLGTSYVDNQINYLSVNANNIFFPVYNINSLTGIPGLAQAFAEARKLGFFGDAQVGYNDFAFLHGSYRSDIDSRLSRSNRFIPYYDVDASLVLSQIIPGLRDNNVFNYLKINGAYSITGNVSALAAGQPYLAAGAYQTVPTLGSVSGFPFNGLGGYALNTNVANPNIKPEQTKEEEIGVELAFLKDRFTFHAAVYDQKTSNGIVKASLPYSSGFGTALVNAANTDNKGLELDFKGNIVQTRNFLWKLSVNYSHNETKVLSINGGLTSLGLSSAAGTSITGQSNAANGNSFAVVGQLFPVIEGTDWVKDANGHVIVNATTGDPSIDPTPKVLGNANPKDIVGLTNGFSYKNFTLTATIDYRGGFKTYNTIGQFMAFTGSSVYTTETSRQRFVFPNSVIIVNGKSVTNTNVTTDDANYNLFPGLFNSVSSPWVNSASAWKLREVSLSYGIPKSVLRGLKIVQAASFTISGRNLIMIRPKTNKWTDPEFSEDTSNAVGENSINQAPPTRIFGASLNLTF